MALSPPLVIGVGNRLRGDDAAGLLVAELLQGRLGEGAVVTSGGDATDLVILWEEADSVIVIDAMVSGRVPGTVVRHDVAAAPLPVDAFATSSHHFGLAEALEISRALGTLPSRLVVYGIEVEATSLGTPLSPRVVDAVHRTVDEIAAEVTRSATAG
jgi:hydrogenase maturation protease